MERISRKAYAKINLGLDVIRRRTDGYHEVKMIMQTIDLWDRLTFQKSEKRGITLTCGEAKLPSDRHNLIYRTAEQVLEQYSISEGVLIELEKNIPIAAGMAGGSTDAAAVYHGLKDLFALDMSIEQMKNMGVQLGADIPYCVEGGTALSEGIGEKLTKLPTPPECILVIAKPDIHVSTKFVYENLHLSEQTLHPDIDGMQTAILTGDLKGITDRMGNVLETVTAKEYPVIVTIEESMKKDGAISALMSGSGPTVFGIFEQKEAAQMAAAHIRDTEPGSQVFVTKYATLNG